MIAHWPKNIRSGTTHQVAHIIDLMPTFLELARGVYPVKYKGRDIRPTEGKSLVPIFKGSVRKGHNALFWEHEGNRAVRQGDWKLVSKFPSDWELYNLAADRLETRNLATRMPDRVRQLETLYATWAKRCGVKPWVGRQTPIGWPDKDRYTR